MNYIEQVAKMMSLKLNEKFTIKHEFGYWWFDLDGLQSELYTSETCEYIFMQLLTGRKEKGE